MSWLPASADDKPYSPSRARVVVRDLAGAVHSEEKHVLPRARGRQHLGQYVLNDSYFELGSKVLEAEDNKAYIIDAATQLADHAPHLRAKRAAAGAKVVIVSSLEDKSVFDLRRAKRIERNSAAASAAWGAALESWRQGSCIPTRIKTLLSAHAVPTELRSTVWSRALGNPLHFTAKAYEAFLQRAVFCMDLADSVKAAVDQLQVDESRSRKAGVALANSAVVGGASSDDEFTLTPMRVRDGIAEAMSQSTSTAVSQTQSPLQQPLHPSVAQAHSTSMPGGAASVTSTRQIAFLESINAAASRTSTPPAAPFTKHSYAERSGTFFLDRDSDASRRFADAALDAVQLHSAMPVSDSQHLAPGTSSSTAPPHSPALAAAALVDQVGTLSAATSGGSLMAKHRGVAIPYFAAESTVDVLGRDLGRTFPTLAFFAGADSIERQQLANVLTAFCFARPDIGYTQGMTYVAAILLLILRPPGGVFSAFQATRSHRRMKRMGRPSHQMVEAKRQAAQTPSASPSHVPRGDAKSRSDTIISTSGTGTPVPAEPLLRTWGARRKQSLPAQASGDCDRLARDAEEAEEGSVASTVGGSLPSHLTAASSVLPATPSGIHAVVPSGAVPGRADGATYISPVVKRTLKGHSLRYGGAGRKAKQPSHANSSSSSLLTESALKAHTERMGSSTSDSAAGHSAGIPNPSPMSQSAPGADGAPARLSTVPSNADLVSVAMSDADTSGHLDEEAPPSGSAAPRSGQTGTDSAWAVPTVLGAVSPLDSAMRPSDSPVFPGRQQGPLGLEPSGAVSVRGVLRAPAVASSGARRVANNRRVPHVFARGGGSGSSTPAFPLGSGEESAEQALNAEQLASLQDLQLYGDRSRTSTTHDRPGEERIQLGPVRDVGGALRTVQQEPFLEEPVSSAEPLPASVQSVLDEDSRQRSLTEPTRNRSMTSGTESVGSLATSARRGMVAVRSSGSLQSLQTHGPHSYLTSNRTPTASPLKASRGKAPGSESKVQRLGTPAPTASHIAPEEPLLHMVLRTSFGGTDEGPVRRSRSGNSSQLSPDKSGALDALHEASAASSTSEDSVGVAGPMPGDVWTMESRVFRCFAALSTQLPLRRFFAVDLEFMEAWFEAFHSALERNDSNAAAELARTELPPHGYLTKWFMTLFAQPLAGHLEVVLVIWDRVLCLGPSEILRAAVALAMLLVPLLKHLSSVNQQALLARLPDDVKIFENSFLQTMRSVNLSPQEVAVCENKNEELEPIL